MTNIAEILKDAPKGLKLYSLIHGEVTLDEVNTTQEYYPIDIVNKSGTLESFTKDGKMYYDYDDAECVLFPSKEHKSWENWQEVLFQVGDIIKYKSSKHKEEVNIQTDIYVYDGYDKSSNEYIGYNIINKNEDDLTYLTINEYEYATPEEREQFFKELNANGYTWNDNTKQMEKLLQDTFKYNLGDWIKRLTPNNKDKKYFLLKVTGINNVSYQLENIYGNRYYKEKTFVEDEKYWEIATEQELIDDGIKERPFTIDDFKPTQFVLARDWNDQEWCLDIYSRKDANDNYVCIHATWDKCIPYNDETKHLLGTTDDCLNKYKTW